MKIIGHRGARGLAPENTIAGLRKGLAHHVDELEFDLRLTRDGIVVLNHNPAIGDQAGNELEIRTHTYQELKDHKPDLATFEEVLDAIGRQVPLHVEIKLDVPIKPIIKIIQARLENGWSAQDFRLASRSLPILRGVQAALPDIQRVVIDNWSSVRAIWKARQVKTRRISMLEYWVWPGFIAAMKMSGYELYAFPPQYPDKERRWARYGLSGIVNNPRKARRWGKFGLAGVFTDFPDRFEK